VNAREVNASEPAAASGLNQPAQSPRLPAASRLGLALFLVYVMLYGGFIGLVLVRPDLLALRPAGGVNLALIAGLGLIAAAFLLAVLYMLGRRAT
jgi:uncharacterized membrane protein (DUF485 family)